MKQFINEVYCSEEPKNMEIYCKMLVSTMTRSYVILLYLKRRTPQAFATWCRNRVKFLNEKSDVVKGIRVRDLYVMEEIIIWESLKSLVAALPGG